MVASIVVTAVSFSLLTASVATSKVEVEGTVSENFRNAYDILVRPPHSRTALEESEQLVRQNYLSGIFGGITMRQYRQISRLPGVEVAAPIAMIGYTTTTIGQSLAINKLVGPQRQQLYRMRFSWTTDRGLSSVPDRTEYQYVSHDRWTYHNGAVATAEDPLTGKTIHPCEKVGSQTPPAKNGFDLRSQLAVFCNSTKTPFPWHDFFRGGEFGGYYLYQFPVLLAAIDPVQEARLVGLDRAVTTGRYLSPADRVTRVKTKRQIANSVTVPRVPVLMADESLLDQTLHMSVQRLRVPQPSIIPSRIDQPRAIEWLNGLSGPTVQRRSISMDDIYKIALKRYHKRANGATSKWLVAPVAYRRDRDGDLEPQSVRNDKFVWRDLAAGFLAPRLAVDTNFRKLTENPASNLLYGNKSYAPQVRWVGLFDADLIQDYSSLSEVPLTTYHAPDARPADARTTKLLNGESLMPNGNMAGYLQQPPTVLTNLRGMKAFFDGRGYQGADGSSPISVIRIRVAGVTGPDEESRERVRVLAERIIRETGLEVDITIGSSPTDETVVLPAGKYGRPELRLLEGWVHKGVTVVLLDAIDQKSLIVSLLVLAVCLLFLVNATLAAVRTRRRELGVLSCLGWPRRRIFAVLELELVAIGLVAGLLGTAAGGVLVSAARLDVATWQVLGITPLAALLAGAAGVVPIWRACAAAPVDAIRPAGRAPRRASRVRSVTGMAFAGMRRLPGRTLLGASCLFVGVAALTSLVAIQAAFHGQVVGTRLGDFVAVQVRGVDYLAAGITIALGAFAIADIAFLNIRERVDEVGILQATGWSARHLRRMFATEGIATAVLGAVAGIVVGLGATTAFLTIGWRPALTGAGIAAGVGITAAAFALILPLSRISRLAPAHALNYE